MGRAISSARCNSLAARRNYIVQDHKYLDAFSKNLSILSAKSPHSSAATMFAKSALHVVTVENTLHWDLMRAWKLSEDDVAKQPMQPACLAYTSYLQAVVQGQPFYEGAVYISCDVCACPPAPSTSLQNNLTCSDVLSCGHCGLDMPRTHDSRTHAAGLAAILPCYWIYQHVGQELKKLGSPNPRYQEWINMYGGAQFDASVVAVLALMDSVAATLHPEQQEACSRHFYVASRYEYMFWMGPYNGETWPV